MTFEEAWPEIKAGKEFRYKHITKERDWTSWIQFKRLVEFNIRYVDELEFQIKREPREWLVRENGRGDLILDQHCNNDALKKIKVREVIE